MLVGVCGAIASAMAYVGFVWAGLNGDAWWHANKLWATAALAPAHVLIAWMTFAALGAIAFILRGRLATKPLAVSAILVGTPLLWVIGLSFVYHSQSPRWWPGFDSRLWRWLVSDNYAEFSFGLMIGFLGLAWVASAWNAASEIR